MAADALLILYARALDAYNQKDYAEARKRLVKVHLRQPDFLRGLLLEAYLDKSEGKILSEIAHLSRLLALFQSGTMESLVFAEAWSLLGEAYSSLGLNREAQSAFVESARLEPVYRHQLAEYSNALFVSNYIGGNQSEVQAVLYKAYHEHVSAIKPYEPCCYHHKKLRIGYLSADFRVHPVAYLAYAFVAFSKREAFSVYVYDANGVNDSVTVKFRLQAFAWREISGLGVAEIAAQVRQDEIDILFELSGHTAGNCLPVLAYRPALLQISGIGYFNSTGLPFVNYFLVDRFCIPEPQQFFSEKMLVMPHTHFCYQPLLTMPPAGEAPCQKKCYVTFGCFNAFSKVTDDMLRLWQQILQCLPDARLLLKHKIFDSDEGKNYVLHRLHKLKLPLERVELRGFTADYLQDYYDVDIALDTYPYTGGVTTLEALYMGVPVITLYGGTHGSRFGFSILCNMNLAVLAADTPAGYVKRAVVLASNPYILAHLHGQLRSMMEISPLMDGVQYVRDIEKLYRQIYQEKLKIHR